MPAGQNFPYEFSRENTMDIAPVAGNRHQRVAAADHVRDRDRPGRVAGPGHTLHRTTRATHTLEPGGRRWPGTASSAR